MNPHETALALLEKAARQRATLLVSDGLGGLLLTRGGAAAAPAPLIRGDNRRYAGDTIVEVQGKRSWRTRFSDVYVKGQSERGAGSRAGAPAVVTLSGAPSATPSVAAGGAAAGVLMTGHATDPEITRWRPHVR